MSTTPINLPKYWPQLEGKAEPEVGTAVKLLYTGIQQHDRAIVQLKQQLDAATFAQTTVTTNTTTTTTGGDVNFPGLGKVSDQRGLTAYLTQQSDNGALILLQDSSSIAVTLNSAVTTPYFAYLTNLGTGTATLTPSSGLVNGGANIILPPQATALTVFDGSNWFATAVEVVPISISNVAHKWLNSYNATTGVFTQTQPAYSDLSGPIDFETNSTPNGSQTKLNLVEGSNVTIADGGTGNITISASTGGSSAFTVRLKSANYTAIGGDAVFCNTSGGGFTITLPAAASNSGITILVKKVTLDSNTLAIARTGSDLIDGLSSQSTVLPYASFEIVSDGASNWYIV